MFFIYDVFHTDIIIITIIIHVMLKYMCHAYVLCIGYQCSGSVA
jgi:hypothetical protein